MPSAKQIKSILLPIPAPVPIWTGTEVLCAMLYTAFCDKVNVPDVETDARAGNVTVSSNVVGLPVATILLTPTVIVKGLAGNDNSTTDTLPVYVNDP